MRAVGPYRKGMETPETSPITASPSDLFSPMQNEVLTDPSSFTGLSTRPPTPRLYELRFAAATAGMTTEAFLQACLRKDIPVTALRIGVRGRWRIDAIEFLAWMKHPTHLQSLSNLL